MQTMLKYWPPEAQKCHTTIKNSITESDYTRAIRVSDTSTNNREAKQVTITNTFPPSKIARIDSSSTA